ncbi:uncharacterized protein [Notothenia coriiceps]|uniref:Uncharacterized protein n=1 Tax=Notothenia coriiceps TaxID=8208 RepID=A0A6I9P1S0_9TELE|nr:PREDICTED: uncharacterized protein LOC104958331 [Notothenia coriiceps]
MFQEWFDGGMVVRLDIFHWIHRFNAAIRTDAHSKYAMFKSALAGAVLAYNRADLELLIEAVRAKDPDTFRSVSEEDVVRLYVTRDQLQYHVRRVTLGAQETFRLIHLAIEELKGPAVLDQSGVSLFKTPGAIDEMWVGQQRHLECIQDPPGMNMYRVAHTTTINGVDLPYYNSLEGFHKSLPHMIPVASDGGTATGAPTQCLVARDGVTRHNRHPPPQQLFGETVEENFQAPAEVDSHELLGLEYLFSQSTGESGSGPFTLKDIIHNGPGPNEEVVQPRQPTPDPEADEANQSDGDNVLDAILPHITLITDETSTVNPPAFEDACSQNSLPGHPNLGRFCSLLVDIGLVEDKLSLLTEQRNAILAAWTKVEDHDKRQQQFNKLYRMHWGNSLYCRTKRHNLVDAVVIQRVKMSIR